MRPGAQSSPLLSIIVPAYNVRACILACLASIISQMGEQDELIVIDDGSTDGTRLLLRQLVRTWKGIDFRLHLQENAGVSAARNQGLALARGEYIVFVDSDDLLRRGALAAITRAATRHHPDVIACDLTLWHPSQPDRRVRVRATYAAGMLIRDSEQIFTSYWHDRRMYLWSKVFRRTIFQRLGHDPFPVGRIFEDVSVIPALLGLCDHLYYLPHSIIDYRQRAGSISRTVDENHCRHLAHALLSASAAMHQAEAGPAARWGFDNTLGHIYVRLFKDTYQLPLRAGSRVRQELRQMFFRTLMETPSRLFETKPAPASSTGYLVDRLQTRKIRQLQRALDGSPSFGLGQILGVKLRALKHRVRHWRWRPGKPSSGGYAAFE